jgi:sentrin-specific protease 1
MNGLFYTAISRVKSGAGLFLEKFDIEYIKADPEVEYKIRAMSTFSPYQFKKVLLHERIFVNYGELKLGYINTRSLLKGKSLEFINNDRNLHALDYLVVADTGLDDSTSTEYLADHLSNWRVQHRFDADDGQRHMGLLLLQGQSASALISDLNEHKWTTGDRMTQILNIFFFFEEFHLDASFVYINKTPTRFDLDKLVETLDSSHLVMGDLNLDMDRDGDQGKIDKLCSDRKRRILKEITTDQFNQLDQVILVNDPAWQDAFSTSYKNYTSDHKVIVVRIPKKGNHFSSQFKQRLHFDQDKWTRTDQKRKAEPCSQSSRRIQPAMTTRKRKSGETEEEGARKKIRRIEPLTQAMKTAIDNVLTFDGQFTIVEIKNILIQPVDIKSLEPRTWLTDNIINSVLYLITSDSPPSFAFSTHFIESFRLQGYSDVIKTQTKPIDREGKGELFSQKWVFIPINPGQNHWTLVAINMEEKTIVYYDSMGDRDQALLHTVLDYLKQEHRDKKKCELDSDRWTLSHADNIPKQENGYDCGLFLLKYAQCLARGQPLDFSQDNMDFFRQRLIWEIINKSLEWP